MHRATLTMLLVLVAGTASAESVTFLDDDTAALAARVELISSATQSLDLSIYQTQDDALALGLFELLRQAACRGVRVRIVMDALYGRTSPAVRRCLLASGVQIRDYHSLRSNGPLCFDHRLHDKLLVADRQVMIVGGRNMTAGYFGLSTGRNYRDQRSTGCRGGSRTRGGLFRRPVEQ